MATLSSLLELPPLQEDIARQAFALLTSKSWVSAKFVYIQASRTSWSTNDFAATDGSAGWTSNPRTLDQAWAALRKAMADPEKGTWLAGELTVQPSGAYAFHFEYDVRPYAQDDLYTRPSDASTILPTDDDWVSDFAEFPRSTEFVPEWFTALAAESAPVVSSSLQAAMSVSPTWPTDEAALERAWGWPDIFDAASDSTIRRLSTPSEIVEILADDSQRETWGRALSQLSQDVFADVYSETVSRQTFDTIVRLWSALGPAWGRADPAGVEDIDRTTPVGSLSTPHPGAAGILLSHITDAIGSIVDGQLADRFGVRPD